MHASVLGQVRLHAQHVLRIAALEKGCFVYRAVLRIVRIFATPASYVIGGLYCTAFAVKETISTVGPLHRGYPIYAI